MEDYQNDSYKNHFPEIDRIKEVSDPSKVDQLDTMLIQQILKQEINHFFIPELIEWEKLEGFSFTMKGQVDFDLSIKRFRKEKINMEQKLDVDYLKNHKIHCNYHDDNTENMSWPVYQCLQSEIKERDTVYFFSVGQWFKVEEDFINEIDTFIENVKKCDLDFPEINGEHEKEANEIFARELPDAINLDRNNAYVAGSQYEVCDLLTKCRRFIHIKWWDSSATLSHLFSQGSVSANILLNEPDQRDKVFEKIIEQDDTFSSVINPDDYSAGQYTIVYGIIYPENKSLTDRLPFFSKANLKQNVTLIRNMGYNVEVVHIKTSSKRLKKK